MNRRRAALLARRQQLLLVRSNELRGQLARDALAWQPPLALADRVHAGWRWLRTHPEAPLAAAAVLLVLRPRRALRWGWRLWTGWRLWLRLQRRLQLPRVTTR
ncbi:MAG: YqjK family protein [Rubrivivax sp.]|nr:YqjK family protein [Rubrivivax sp.]